MDELYGVTKNDWRAYENVRKSGVTNIFDREVQRLAFITRNQHLSILAHRGEMATAWKEAH